MFKSDKTTEKQLFAFTPRELVADDSDVWLYLDLFDHLDLEEFDWDYCSQGEEAHEPRLMLRTIFYGLCHGIITGRKLSDMCRHDVRYVVLSGENHPSYRSFSRFVLRHQQRMEGLFVQVVRLAQKMGLVSLGRIAIDGCKFKANTSKHRAMSYGRMSKAVAALKAELDELSSDLQSKGDDLSHCTDIPGEISIREQRLAKILAAKAALELEKGGEGVEDKEQKSFHDHDAMPFRKKSGEFAYVYNCQAAVDEDNQIVVAAAVHDSTSDSTALPGLMDEVADVCQDSADELLADAGYKSYANIHACDERGSVGYLALGKGETKREKAPIQDLKYYAGQDQYRCMRGKVLKNVNRADDSRDKRALNIPKKACRGCPHQDHCSIFPRRGATFWIPSGKFRRSARAYAMRMRTAKSEEIYRRRKVIVEPVFGNIKNKGIRIVHVGRDKIRCWWQMACLAHNIEKVIKRWVKGSGIGPFLYSPLQCCLAFDHFFKLLSGACKDLIACFEGDPQHSLRSLGMTAGA